MQDSTIGNSGNPYLNQTFQHFPARGLTAKGKERLEKLGIDELLASRSRSESLDILGEELLYKNSLIKKVQRGNKFNVKKGEKTKLRKPSYTPQEIENSLEYLEVFCFFIAQTRTNKNLFLDAKRVHAPIHEAVDLIEKINTEIQNEQITSKEDVKKLKALVDRIFKETDFHPDEIKLLKPSFEKAKRIIAQTARRVIITS